LCSEGIIPGAYQEGRVEGEHSLWLRQTEFHGLLLSRKKEQQPDKYRCCSFFLISAKIAVERLHPGQLSELSPG
jgi:hypothetical protein